MQEAHIKSNIVSLTLDDIEKYQNTNINKFIANPTSYYYCFAQLTNITQDSMEVMLSIDEEI